MKAYNLSLEWKPTDTVLNDYVYSRSDLVKSLRNNYTVNILDNVWFKPLRITLFSDRPHTEILLDIYNILNDIGLKQWFSLYPRLRNRDSNKRKRN